MNLSNIRRITEFAVVLVCIIGWLAYKSVAATKTEVFIYQPSVDWKKSPIKYLFIKKEKDIWEISIVFSREVHPLSIGNLLSTIYRKVVFRRKEDIETFMIKQMGDKLFVSFPNTYSGNQVLDSILPYHRSKTFELAKNSKIAIYINTWNHLMSIKDSNPNLPKVVCLFTLPPTKNATCYISEQEGMFLIPIIPGGRMVAENFVKGKIQ